MHRQYGGVQEGVAGPVERKLSSFPRLQGLVFGAWNEASPDVHNLVHTVASARLQREQELQDDGAVARRRRMSSEGALAILKGQGGALFPWWRQERRQDFFWTGCRFWGGEQQKQTGGEGGRKLRSGGWERSSVLTTSPSCLVVLCTVAAT